MTVYVEAEETQKDVTVSNVEVKDLSGNDVIIEDAQEFDVFSGHLKGQIIHLRSEGCAQSYATAGDALYSLAESKQYEF